MMPIWTLERRAWSTTTNYAVVYAFEEVVGQFADFNGILYYCSSIVLHKEVGKQRLSHSGGRACLLLGENLCQ